MREKVINLRSWESNVTKKGIPREKKGRLDMRFKNGRIVKDERIATSITGKTSRNMGDLPKPDLSKKKRGEERKGFGPEELNISAGKGTR